jgi:hypothetical protein
MFSFSENEAKKLLSDTFDIASDALEFFNDICFQGENRETLNSRNARNITYRLGRTEERYNGAISLCDTIVGIATKISDIRNPADVPIMQRIHHQEYAECINCYKPVIAAVSLQNHYWRLPLIPIKCYDCHRLTALTDMILIYASIKKAQDKSIENAFEKSVDWLARQFGNDANEIKKMYYAERVK